MRCRLCGHEFDAAGLACHTGCPLGSRCNLICCPNCGYQVVDESRSWVVGVVQRLWPSVGRVEARPAPVRPAQDTVPLSHIPVGMAVKVRGFEEMAGARLARISGFGLIPGSLVEILQRHPTPIVRIGETELSLDMEILAQIWVQTPESV